MEDAGEGVEGGLGGSGFFPILLGALKSLSIIHRHSSSAKFQGSTLKESKGLSLLASSVKAWCIVAFKVHSLHLGLMDIVFLDNTSSKDVMVRG